MRGFWAGFAAHNSLSHNLSPLPRTSSWICVLPSIKHESTTTTRQVDVHTVQNGFQKAAGPCMCAGQVDTHCVRLLATQPAASHTFIIPVSIKWRHHGSAQSVAHARPVVMYLAGTHPSRSSVDTHCCKPKPSPKPPQPAFQRRRP